jgi:hypothetical protein
MYWLKGPTLFRSPPISSFVPASEWMPFSSYFYKKRLPPIGLTFLISITFNPPPPLRCRQPQILYFYFLPSSYPCRGENQKEGGSKGPFSGWGRTHTHTNNISQCSATLTPRLLCSRRSYGTHNSPSLTLSPSNMIAFPNCMINFCISILIFSLLGHGLPCGLFPSAFLTASP